MKTRTLALTALAIPLALGSSYRLAPSLHAQPVPGIGVGVGDDDHGRDAREMGHRDGMQAAYHDMRDHRRADADDHDQYRHPPVDRHFRDAYRDGFRDGYSEAMRRGPGEGYHGDDDHH